MRPLDSIRIKLYFLHGATDNQQKIEVKGYQNFTDLTCQICKLGQKINCHQTKSCQNALLCVGCSSDVCVHKYNSTLESSLVCDS